MLHSHMAVLLVTVKDAKPAPGGLVVLIVSCAMLWLLFKIDHKLPKEYHADDIIRTAVAFLGVSGVVMSIPLFNQFGRAILDFFVGGAQAAAGTRVTVSVIGVIVGVLLIVPYFKKPTVGRLFIMTLGSYFLFSTDAGQNIVTWYANNVGVNAWNLLVDVYNRATHIDLARRQ